jgi:hypothetical protein
MKTWTSHLPRALFQLLCALGCVLTGLAGASTRLDCTTGGASRNTMPLVIGLIDTTTPRDDRVISLYERLVQAKSHPGSRTVLVSFAALRRGEEPRVIFDAATPANPTEAERYDITVSEQRKADACSQRVRKSLAIALRDATAKLSAHGTGEYSELLYAINWASKWSRSHERIRIVWLTDGLLHSKDGQSFYANQHVRLIQPELELKRALASVERGAVGRSTEITILGVGIQPENAKRYARPAEQLALEAFWRELARSLGFASIHVGMTVPD